MRLCSPLEVVLGIRAREEIWKRVEERRAPKRVSVISTAVDPPQCWWTELNYPAFAPGEGGTWNGKGKLTGRNFSILDSQIAAIAVRFGYTLVTRNTKDMARLPVEIFNPWE